MFVLRDYQRAAVDSIFTYFDKGGGNPLVGMPTGTGKSLVLSQFIKEAYQKYPGQRIIKLTHVKELIEQNYKTLLNIWPSAPAGIFSAGLGQKETCFPITFAGIASIVKMPRVFGHIDLVLIDEAHLVSTKHDTMYQLFLAKLREVNPYLRVIGFTATHFRVGQGLLTQNGGLFNDVCFDLTTYESFNWLLEQGYLCPLIPKKTRIELPVDGVRIQGGEYVQKDLQEAVDQNDITYGTLKETIELSTDRDHWLVFASGINHVLHVRDALIDLGINATCVHSKMGTAERDDNIRGFKSGKYRAMVNNGILTTGFDFPAIDLICMLRPTRSPGLWVQMLGRGTRPIYVGEFDLTTAFGRLAAQAAGPKRECLVLDFAGNTRRLGPINDPVIPKAKGAGGGGTAPIKLCEVCGTYNHASVRFCVFCKNEFIKHLNLDTTASTDELIKTNKPVIELFQVDRVIFNEHNKKLSKFGENAPNKPPSLRVSYYCGLRLFEEWICLEHKGFPLHKAHSWWRRMSKAYEWAMKQIDLNVNIQDPQVQYALSLPQSVSVAITRHSELKTPSHIKVHINRPHPEIVDYEFRNEAYLKSGTS
jgi:DNA repair protein RadD